MQPFQKKESNSGDKATTNSFDEIRNNGSIAAYNPGGKPYLSPEQCVPNFEEDLRSKKVVLVENGAKEPPHYEIKQNVVVPTNSINGLLILAFFTAAAIYYFYVRATYTLNVGYKWYAGIILAIEIIISTSTFLYAALLTKTTVRSRSPGLPPAQTTAELKNINPIRFDLRVLIPCYKEHLNVVEATLRACLAAQLPHNTSRTVYVCDDGGDPQKASLCAKLGHEVYYVTGRTREKGEVNGKSNNLNNCLRLIYPASSNVPLSEIIYVFDADMVPKQEFFLKTLEVMQDDSVALCLTPQAFHNVDPDTDIYNNINLPFWEYILPGANAFGFIACTGTNFALRATHLHAVGWFPTYTITEDYALGIEMKALEFRSVFLKEYLALGEAPLELRNIFRQRSRWCKGQMQVFFGRTNPLLNGGLSLWMRLLYAGTCWSYITNMLAVPLCLIIPFLAMVFGVLPFQLNRHFALGVTLYLAACSLANGFCRKRSHAKAMWFGSISNTLLWFTNSKAVLNVLLSKIGFKRRASFKSTRKLGAGRPTAGDAGGCFGGEVMEMEGTKDIYVIIFLLLVNCVTLAVVIYRLHLEGPKAYLFMVLFWALYSAIPLVLFVAYAGGGHSSKSFAGVCTAAMVAAHLVALGGVICIWLVPREYDFGELLRMSLQFYSAQRSGPVIELDNPVPWRGDSALGDALGNASLVGGWYADGGHIKSSYAIAITTAMLSWSLIVFQGGYASSGNLAAAENTVKWGTDYLLRCHTQPGRQFVAQVGNLEIEKSYWGRPEDMTEPRPAYAINATTPGGADVIAAASAALAAAAKAVSGTNRQYADTIIEQAEILYNMASNHLATHTTQSSVTYSLPSDSFYDDLAWAAGWLYVATGNNTYLSDAQRYYDLHSTAENAAYLAGRTAWDYQHLAGALDLLLAVEGGNVTHGARLKATLKTWMRGAKGVITYTPDGLALAQGGTLQHTANAAMLAALWSHQLGAHDVRFRCWARRQVAVMLGDKGQSYLVGFGERTPRYVPHRAASCPSPSLGDCTWDNAYFVSTPNPHTLYGALVGGPDARDGFTDVRDASTPGVQVSLLNNAGLTAALAGLVGISEARCQQGHGLVQNKVRQTQGLRQQDV